MRGLRGKFSFILLVILGVPPVFAVMLKTMEHTVPVALMLGAPVAIGWFLYQRRRRW